MAGHRVSFPRESAVMTVTLVVNLFVVSYEQREARRLNSEVLHADAKHTRSDVLTSGAVLGALIGVWWGYPLLDPLAAILVAVFIGHAGWEIAQQSSRILADEIVIAEDDVRAVVDSVPDVLGCHQIRTRGSADHVFMDLHLWLDGGDDARVGPPHVPRREGPADDAVPVAPGRRHPYRAASSR